LVPVGDGVFSSLRTLFFSPGFPLKQCLILLY
jgi:hypothetical protein